MQYLLIVLDHGPSVQLLELESDPWQGHKRMRVAGHEIDIRLGGELWKENVEFFDWLCDDRANIIGFELHVTKVSDLHCQLIGQIASFPGADFSEVFPRYWLTDQRHGQPQGAEEFDCYYGISKSGEYALLLGTGALSRSQINSLRANHS